MTTRTGVFYPFSCVLVLLLIAVAATATELEVRRMIENLEQFRFDKLGHPQIQSDSILPVLASADKPHRLLIVTVQFPEIGFDRFAGDPKQDENNRAYLQSLLFEGGAGNPREGTLSHYYRHQSRGLYNVTGDIYPVVTVERPLHYYGRPIQSSDGQWRNDEFTDRLVEDTIRTAYQDDPEFPWAEYDQWDPEDFDGDGTRDEPDGYLDHFVMVFAGKGQASCQGLYKIGEKLTPNAKADAFDQLNTAEKACADRIWPHRGALNQNLGKGPTIDGRVNPRGGVQIFDKLWLLDYNMQSEYTEVSTFIHEFGHSLGLPDIYARQTNNSTASWEVMSGTRSPLPQEMSTWSRMVLGWLQPCVLRAPEIGGEKNASLLLKTMNSWSGQPGYSASDGLCDAAMVILPPKTRELRLGPLGEDQGKQAIYSGQGNDMNRTLSRQFDLDGVPDDTEVQLAFDAWFRIEADWDYLYVEAAKPGEDFLRLLPVDKTGAADRNSVMPSDKGHDGKGTLPGFTGRSGDLDGDGKVEGAKGCDPDKDRVLAEDRVGQVVADPCDVSQWVHAVFDLDAYRGQKITLRFTYFTDTAAVEDGALIDNVELAAIGFRDDFESASIDGWASDGFTLSGGEHDLPVPHFYLLEYRDPYADFAGVTNYDAVLQQPSFLFYPENGQMWALNVNYRPGMLMWYYNGTYLWSQNEPAQFGPGRGFLLLVDANPQEFSQSTIPENYFRNQDGWTFYEFDEQAQPRLHRDFVDVMCFQRRPAYYSSEVTQGDREHCAASLREGKPPLEALRWNARELMYGYTIINEFLPGPERLRRKSASTLYDVKIRDGKTQYRLNDRALRNRHSADAPFALEPFEHGIEIYAEENGQLVRQSSRPFAAMSRFSDARPNRYQNPKLPFGGADIPEAGLIYELSEPDRNAPPGTRIRVDFSWAD